MDRRKLQKKILHYFAISCVVFWCFCLQDGSAETFVPKDEVVPAIIVFGDSIVDPGNNNYIKTLIKCNFPPYGRNFNGETPTGRFSNGKVPSDFIGSGVENLTAEEFGVKDLLPAYLDPDLTTQELLTGVSFASGGSGYDPLTAKITSVLSLSDQLEMFRDYIARIKAAVGEERAATILSKSIFVVCTGSDDIANTYFITPFRRVQYDVPAYTDLMLESASSFLQQLYSLGGRRIGVLSLPAIGCVPSQRTLGGGVERGCSDAANGAALDFNSKLSSLVSSLGNSYPDAKFVYLDIYGPLLSLVKNPGQYGFEEVEKGCCGTGNIEVSVLCNPLTMKTCTNADKYIFWDSYHPSQRAYEILTPGVLHENLHKFF